jgi:AraC family transcriptional regulator
MHIDDSLNTELSLESVSKITHYSPFHFHRIFKNEIGETLNQYINRRRIEKCAGILFRRKEIPINEIFSNYGFTSNSSFTRAFKKYYKVSPTEFRKQSPSKFSKIRQTQSKNGQKSQVFEYYICNINNHLNWIQMNAKIEVKKCEKVELAYINCIGIQGQSPAFGRLMNWAGPKGLLNKPDFKMATIYHDSFKVTAPNKVRMSACLVLDAPIDIEGEIGLRTIEEGKFITAHYEIRVHEFEQAWTSLFVWMNENGYKKADQDPYEIYNNDFNTHPEKKCIVDLYIPVL